MNLTYFIYPFSFNGTDYIAQLLPMMPGRFAWYIFNNDLESIKDNKERDSVVEYFNKKYIIPGNGNS